MNIQKVYITEERIGWSQTSTTKKNEENIIFVKIYNFFGI